MTWRELLILGISIVVLIVAVLSEPIPQDALYHLFSDERDFIGLPNFLNVASNLPFLIVGAAGVGFVLRQDSAIASPMRPAWLLFFAAVAMTAFGSGYYHFEPNNSTLVWDRLPMTLAFMSLVAIVIAEYYSQHFARRLLLILLTLGVGSVLYWWSTESRGHGDLRPYAIVQFLPMIHIPLLLILYPGRSKLARYFWGMIALYVAAKLAEHFDGQFLAVGDIVSGHSLKHLIAACAPAYLLLGLRRSSRLSG